MLAQQRDLLKPLGGLGQQRGRRRHGLVLPHEFQGLRAQIGHGREVHAARVLEHPVKALLPFKVGGDRRHTSHAAREGGGGEEELSPVHRHSHRFQGCHEAVQLGPALDGTRGQLLLGRIHQDEQHVVGPWSMRARFPLIDHPNEALAVGHRLPDGRGLCL
jgi:hypothetical protein